MLDACDALADTGFNLRAKIHNVLSIAIMPLLLVGFYGLFAGLVLFSEGVIEPDSTS